MPISMPKKLQAKLDKKINEAKKINTHIAVAAGKNKVEAIIAAEMNDSNAVIVTDEAAATKIVELMKAQN